MDDRTIYYCTPNLEPKSRLSKTRLKKYLAHKSLIAGKYEGELAADHWFF
jgi:hypothetical protein